MWVFKVARLVQREEQKKKTGLAHDQVAGPARSCTHYRLQSDVLVRLNSTEKCLLALTRTDLIPELEIPPQAS